MIIYFTGTGNSRWCAQMLANRLDDQAVDVFPWMREGSGAELHSNRPWVFVCPTYGWRLPRIFAEFLRKGSFTGSREAYFVLTCGSEIGNVGAGIQALCGQKGFTCRGTLQVVMHENYITLFNAPQEGEARKIIAAARPVVEEGAALIRAGEDFPARRAGVLDRIRSGPVNAMFYRFIIKGTPFYATSACVGCGKCAEACVLGNIELRDGKPVWGNRCTHCMACICGCPQKAVEYAGSSQGKPRYQCPDYEETEGT